MLVAPARDYYGYRPQQIPVPPSAGTGRRTAGKRQKTGRVEILVIAVLLTAFATGMLLTSQAASLTAKGYHLNQLRREVQEMQKFNERQRLELSRLRSLDRIEKIATTQLGMRKPSQNDWELLPGAAGGQVRLAEAELPRTEISTAGRGPSPALAAVGKVLARLGVGVRVEASEI